MSKSVLILKNITHENPGLMSELLDKYNINYDIIDLSQKVQFPEIEKYDLIIIMGGPDSANDKSEKILKELDYVSLALKKNIPIFGICLGLQLMVKAHGGEVYKNPIEEIGFRHNGNKWYTINLTEEGFKDPLFQGINNNFKVFQLHGETVNLGKGEKLLGTGEFCKNQIIKIGVFNYGFQFHFELTQDLLKLWTRKAPELKKKNTITILNDYKIIKENFFRRGKKIFENFLKVISFIER